MARGGAARKRKARATKGDARLMPAAEALQHGEFASVGLAHRRVPVIDTMLTRGQLTAAEYRSLSFYRDQAVLAERSPLRSCLDNSQGGSGDIPLSASITSAILTTARIERDLGSLAPITRAIAVDDMTLTAWCVKQYGGRERYNDRGDFIAIVPVSEKLRMGTATMELKMAAHRIVA